MERIAYLCDGIACNGKSSRIGCGDCSRTFNVEHAVNFERNGDIFCERNPEDVREIKEKLAAIESLLQQLPEIQAAVFFRMLDEYQTARIAGKKASDIWDIVSPAKR